MKIAQKEQKISPHQALLDEYLTLKPHRAVDRILNENELSYCVELYNLLQQNVKTNTNQLRSVLYSKHENLHQCSQMIEKIQEFAYKVKNIQEEIDTCMKAPVVSQDWKLDMRIEMSPVEKIEQLTGDKKFTEALKECKMALQMYTETNSMESDPDAYYITFLKVEIMQKLEEYLQNTSLKSDIISEAISALRQFLTFTTVEQLTEYIQQSVAPISQVAINSNSQSTTIHHISGQIITILQLLHEAATQSSEFQSSYLLPEDQIIEVIFKFKLLAIKQSVLLDKFESSEHKVEHLYQKVFNYFSDLLQILDQVEKKHLKTKIQQKIRTENFDQRNKLHRIFTLNIQKAVNHISELFITNQKPSNSSDNDKLNPKTNALAFETELYEKLLDSKEFLSTLDALSLHFKKISSLSSSDSNQEIELVSIIKNLWRDFYHQMLDIITEKINPCSWYKIPDQTSLPSQLAVYSATQFSKLTSQKLTQYQKQLQVFRSNFTELLNKSKNIQEKQSIVRYFLELKRKVQQDCEKQVFLKRDNLQKLTQRNNIENRKRTEHQVRQLILMYLIVQSYNLSWFQQIEGSINQMLSLFAQDFGKPQFNISLFESSQNQIMYKIINSYFDSRIDIYRTSEPKYIGRWQQQLDQLFASYCSFLKLNQSLKNSLKKLVLTLIKSKLHSLESK